MICVGFMCGDEVPLPARYCSAVSAKVPTGWSLEPPVKPLSSQDKVSCAQKKDEKGVCDCVNVGVLILACRVGVGQAKARNHNTL